MKNLITILFLFISTTLFAQQNGTISGTVIDAQNNEPLSFVNIMLTNTKTNDARGGTMTTEQGKFVFEKIPDGEYQLRFSFVGYQERIMNVTVSPTKRTVQLRPVSLKEESMVLDEFEVVGEVTQMRFDVDKKIFQVNEGVLAAGAGTDEILKNIPSVNVDSEGNLSLRNNENVEVWINGKPSGLTVENRAQILEQLPAETVESVEIITNPSSKYRPEGSAGIINIILKKNRKTGYYGSVSTTLYYPWGANVGGNFNYNNKKIDAYINLSYRRNERERGGYNNRMSFGSDRDTSYLNQTNKSIFESESMFLRTGLDYRIDDNNTIGISALGMIGKGNNETNYHYTLLDQNQSVTETYTQHSLLDRDNNRYNISLDFKHNFSKKGHELTAFAEYSDYNFNSSSEYHVNRVNKSSIRYTDSERESGKFLLQADYVLPIHERSKFEAGYSSSFSSEDTYNSLSTEKENIVTPNYVDDFTFDRQIHSVYALYKNRIRTFGLQLGLRGEYTITDWENETEQGQSSHFDLFPSLFLSKQINENDEIQLSVTHRINRPSSRRMNPFVNSTDSTEISYGNPNLTPEHAWSYELSYIKIWERHTLSSSAYFRQTNDVIQSISFFVQPEGSQGYIEKTYENITSSRNAGFEFTLKNKFFSFLELTSMLNLYYYKIDGNTAYDTKNREDFSWNVKFIGNLIFMKGFSGQVAAGYRAPVSQAQGKSFDSYTVDVGVRKIFFDILSVNLAVKDLLNSNKNRSEIFGDNFYQKSERYAQGPNVALTLSYNFGNQKAAKQSKKKRSDTGFSTDEEY